MSKRLNFGNLVWAGVFALILLQTRASSANPSIAVLQELAEAARGLEPGTTIEVRTHDAPRPGIPRQKQTYSVQNERNDHALMRRTDGPVPGLLEWQVAFADLPEDGVRLQSFTAVVWPDSPHRLTVYHAPLSVERVRVLDGTRHVIRHERQYGPKGWQLGPPIPVYTHWIVDGRDYLVNHEDRKLCVVPPLDEPRAAARKAARRPLTEHPVWLEGQQRLRAFRLAERKLLDAIRAKHSPSEKDL